MVRWRTSDSLIRPDRGRSGHNRRMPAPFVRPAAPADSDAIGLVHVRSWQSAYRGEVPRTTSTDWTRPIARRYGGASWSRTQPSRGGVLVAVAEGGGITGFAWFGLPGRRPIAGDR